MAGRILVTPRSLTAAPDAEIERLTAAGFDITYGPAGAQPSESDLIALVPGCVGWLAGVEPVSPAVIEAADALRVISRNGVGIDNLPVDLLSRRGIAVAIAQAANAQGVAELAIGLMLSALRHIPRTDAGIKAGAWPRHKGREIASLTVGVIGCGAVGGRVARLSAALGATVVAHDPMRPELDLPVRQLTWMDRDAVLASSDIVSLHCPPDRGKPIIDARVLDTMRTGAILINTARAALIDDAAVFAALEDGRLSGYAADVFAQEPPSDLALAGHPLTIATAHIGGFTSESVTRATRQAVDNLLDHLAVGR